MTEKVGKDQTMKYAIPECNIEKLEKKLAKVAKKAEKYGCDFSYTRTGDHFETVEYFETDSDVVEKVLHTGDTVFRDDRGRIVKEIIHYIDIDVEGTAKIDGWQYVATLDYTPKGNVILGTGKVEIPEKYYTCTPWCEHCKTARDRKSSYIVWNEETGAFAQLGRNCLRDYTGGLSAEYVASYEQWIREAEEASVFSGFGGYMTRYYDTLDYLAICAEAIRIYGYIKRDTIGQTPTADLAENLYRVTHSMGLGLNYKYIMERYDEAVCKGFNPDNPESIDRAKKVREWIVNNEQNNNYFHNLKVACGNDQVDCGKLGLLASSFPAYDRELEYQAEKLRREIKDREAGALSKYLGSIGDRITVTIAECKAVTSWETQWGVTTIYKFVDTSGNHIIWKTSSWVDEERCVGKTIKGTVKDHREFRDVCQTELTRCKIA